MKNSVSFDFNLLETNCASLFSIAELTDELLAAQLFVFFIAGFETSSSTMSNCIFELAMNHEVQDKLREEIKEEMERNNGVVTYEGIKNMKYLDKVFNGMLRIVKYFYLINHNDY